MKQSKFYEATSCLEEMIDADECDYCVGIPLLKAECYVQLGRESKAMNAIKHLEGVLSRGRPVQKDLLITLGEALGSQSSFLRSVILFHIASKILSNSRLGADEIMEGITQCIKGSKNIISAVWKGKVPGVMDPDTHRTRVVILDFGIEYMK